MELTLRFCLQCAMDVCCNLVISENVVNEGHYNCVKVHPCTIR